MPQTTQLTDEIIDMTVEIVEMAESYSKITGTSVAEATRQMLKFMQLFMKQTSNKASAFSDFLSKIPVPPKVS